MVENKIVQEIVALGFSEYEARAYCALLKRQPATAYEISKESGIPSSKVYEVIGRLLERGVLLPMQGEGKKKRYLPVPVNEFLESHRQKIEQTFDVLERELPAIGAENPVSAIWNFSDYAFLMDKAGRMIDRAAQSILLSTWQVELAELAPILREAEQGGIQVAIVHFGPADQRAGQLFEHPIADTLYEEKGGRGFTMVVDAQEALMATVMPDERVEGAWSANRGFVTLAEDYIKHDVYIMKIVNRFNDELQQKFGENYHLLRDIFTDKEQA